MVFLCKTRERKAHLTISRRKEIFKKESNNEQKTLQKQSRIPDKFEKLDKIVDTLFGWSRKPEKRHKLPISEVEKGASPQALRGLKGDPFK